MLLGWNFGVATCFLRKFYFCWFYAICLLSGHYIVIAMFNLMIPRNIIGRISGLAIVQKMHFWSLNWHNSIGDLTITFFIFLFKLSDIEAWIHNLPNCIFKARKNVNFECVVWKSSWNNELNFFLSTSQIPNFYDIECQRYVLTMASKEIP